MKLPRLPLVKKFEDYHEIPAFCENLNEVTTKTVRFKEIAFNYFYWGVFYVGRAPDYKTLRKMLVRKGWRPVEDEDECFSFYPSGQAEL